MASLSLSNEEIYKQLATTVGISRNPAAWDDQTLEDMDRCIRSGRRRFFAAHDWSWLEASCVINTKEPFNDGTVAATAGVVDVTGGTVPTDAAGQKFAPDAGLLYDINARTDADTFTLHDTSVDITAGSDYKIYFTRYPLPANFAAFTSPITVENNTVVRESVIFPEWTARAFGNQKSLRVGKPELFSITQEVAAETGIPSYYLNVYPLPDQLYSLRFTVRIQPGDALEEEGDVFPHTYAEIMLEAILAAAEVMYNDDMQGPHNLRFAQLLPEFIQKDRIAKSIRNMYPVTPQKVRPINPVITAPLSYEV